MAKVDLKGTISAKLEITGNFTIIYNFAYQHMRSARKLAEKAGKIEQENSGNKIGPFFEELITYVSSSIIISVCALEANINEILATSPGIFEGYDTNLREQFFELLEQKSIEEKYRWGLLLNKKPPLKFDKEYSQSLKCLIDLRNALVHYKPETDKELRYSKKLEKQLRAKIDGSPFIDKKENFLTRRIFSYSCAKWAVNTALNFSKEYSQILNIQDKFSNLRCL